MKEEKKSVIIKSINRKDEYSLVKTTISGITYISVRKNGNPILKCAPREFIKFKRLISENW